MGDAVVDERTSLLRTDQSAGDVEQRWQSHINALRRISSAANLHPHHEEHPPDNDESASATTIWTIVPVSILGLSNVDVVPRPWNYADCSRRLRCQPRWQPHHCLKSADCVRVQCSFQCLLANLQLHTCSLCQSAFGECSVNMSASSSWAN